jgi:transcriptional regulator with XRE-family HTH domain
LAGGFGLLSSEYSEKPNSAVRALSRDALVKKADITVTTLYKIETGKMPKPSFEIMKHIAQALNISLDTL